MIIITSGIRVPDDVHDRAELHQGLVGVARSGSKVTADQPGAVVETVRERSLTVHVVAPSPRRP